MKNMLSKQVVKKEFKKDLGLDKWGHQIDPKQKMELRWQQVRWFSGWIFIMSFD